jgi:hypothetical protein
MNKINLKDNIWIEGFDSELNLKYNRRRRIVYSGKTSEIPEELAKECVQILAKTSLGNFYRNYQYDKPQPVAFTKCTAKESIQSACGKKYCIIYKIG